MKVFAGIVFLVGAITLQPAWAEESCPEALDFQSRPLLEEQAVRLCDLFRHQVVLVVNTASKCAFTPQYEGLEQLYARYRERGLLVTGFPSNDFGAQEPGTEKQIRDFCRLTYSVEFPMFAKTRVRGAGADPLGLTVRVNRIPYRVIGVAAATTLNWNGRYHGRSPCTTW